MKLDQLRYFVQVVENRSFNQAAKNLYMTQPALTASIQALEEELNITLLHRSNRGTFPTEYGLRIYYDCKDLLEALEKKIFSWQSFAQEKTKISGVVRLAAIPVACNFILEDIIWGIQSQYPEIRVSLHEIPMTDFSYEMLQGRYNIGLTAVPIEHQREEEMRYQNLKFYSEVLLQDEYQIYLSTQHPLAQQETLTQEEYENLMFITYSSSSDSDFSRRFFSKEKTCCLNSLGNILQAIAENKGASVFLYQMLRNNWYVKNGFICVKPIEEITLCPSQHHLIWAGEEFLTSAEKVVVSFIRTHYAQFYATSVS